MTKKLIMIFCILITFNLISCDSQNDEGAWNLSLGTAELHDVARDVIETRDNAFMAIGYSMLPNSQIYLAKTDAEGELLWESTISGGDDAFGYSIKETDDQGFILGGIIRFEKDRAVCTISGGRCYDCLLVKTDRNGKEIWRTNVGSPELDEYLKEVEQTPDGGYIAVGGQADSETQKALVVRFDADGNVVFQKSFGADCPMDGLQIHDTGDGNFLVVGKYEDQTTGLFLLRIDQMGNEIWRKALVDPSFTRTGINSVILSDGGILAAFNERRSTEMSYKYIIKLLRIDAEGNELWSHTITGDQDNTVQSISINQTEDGGFILTGSHSVPGERGNLLLLKVNSKGEEIWRKIYGGYMTDVGYAARQATDGGFIVAGYTESYIPGGVPLSNRMNRNNIPPWSGLVINDPANFWLIKTDAEGNAPLFPQNLSSRDIGFNNRP